MSKELNKFKGSSLRIIDPNCAAELKFAEGEESTPELVMTAYSGGVIPGHWWWGDLVIDLEGLSIPNKKIPILEDHNTDKKIGFATKWSKEGNKLTVAESSFVDTPESLNFRSLSKQGYPYEASIYAKPSKIQSLQGGEVAMVNGFEMKGPGTIWRKAVLKESSVCTFGYDPNTKSAAMADDGEAEMIVECLSTQNPKTEEQEPMTRDKFKTEHADEYNALVAEITAGAEAKFAPVKADLESKLTAATETNNQLTAESKETEKRLLALERNNQLQAEKDSKSKASTVFAEKFKDSGLPERLFAKIERLVSPDKFIAEGVLDVNAFSEAIEAELKDWTTDTEGVILGLSAGGKELGDDKTDTKACDEAVARMRKHLGQTDAV